MKDEFYRIDIRLILLSFLSTAFCIWFLALEYLAFFGLVYTCMYFYLAKKEEKQAFFYKNLLFFCCMWFIFLVLIQSIKIEEGQVYFVYNAEYLGFALEYILRIFLLALLGLTIFILASPKEYALALVYFSSFISKEHAWKVGLITLLILKFFIEFYELIAKMIEISFYRIKKRLPFHKRLYLFCQSFLRLLTEKNYNLSIALYARGLNKKEVFVVKQERLLAIENIKNNAVILCINLIPCLLALFSLFMA